MLMLNEQDWKRIFTYMKNQKVSIQTLRSFFIAMLVEMIMKHLVCNCHMSNLIDGEYILTLVTFYFNQ